ncbi:DUF6094 domain-containing protein [Pseudobacillus sp. 179-B 2D1 NHS]|uniref:DUF6094 domain-containing protein n=1 Tax=Pseudobacillus sp. 179-B 2D1 NHS TaxID=3374292 RepID=UPI003879AC8D
MSHVGNKLLSGFFAFPERQGKHLAKLIKQRGNRAAWFDPTCGEGAILNQLSIAVEKSEDCMIRTYGVELDKGRFQKAEQVLDEVINAPIESMVVSNNIFSLVFLNPPYDYGIKGAGDDKADRKEFLELERNTRYLAPEGILVYVIPSYRFADKKIARYLSSHFEETEMMRFSDEDYKDFRQCVFIGRKKSSTFKKTDEEKMSFYQKMEEESFVEKYIPTIDSIENVWTIPEQIGAVKTFYTKVEDKERYHEGIVNSPGFLAFKNRTKPRTLQTGGDPILPINQGQMALLLASGAINGLLGIGETLHLIQGQENVETIEEEETQISDSGAKTTKYVERTKRSVSVKLLTPKGIIQKLQ